MCLPLLCTLSVILNAISLSMVLWGEERKISSFLWSLQKRKLWSLFYFLFGTAQDKLNTFCLLCIVPEFTNCVIRATGPTTTDDWQVYVNWSFQNKTREDDVEDQKEETCILYCLPSLQWTNKQPTKTVWWEEPDVQDAASSSKTRESKARG